MWWSSLSTLQQVTFVVACVATGIMIIQIIFMLIGGSHDADIDVPGGAMDADIDIDVPAGGISDAELDIPGGISDADIDVDVPGGATDAVDGDVDTGGGEFTGGGSTPFGLRLLSLRSIIAFAAIGGWICYTLCYTVDWYIAVIIAVICGMAAACGMAGFMIGLEKMQSSGNINPNNAVGKIGTVYLTVPPSRSGRGKINVLVQERYAEYDAITNSSEPLPTTTEIKVVGYAGNNVLIVERYKKPSITVTTE